MQGLLVKSSGTLLNVEHAADEWRLLLDPADAPPFKAVLSGQVSRDSLDGLRLGSQLALAGVYEVDYDEVGSPHAYQLRLRSAGDVSVVRLPSW